MSELAALQRLSMPISSFHTISPSSPSMRTNNSPKHLDQFNDSVLLPRMPALSSRTPSLFEMQTMGYGFRGAHVGCPHGVTAPRLDSSKGAVDAASSEYRVEVPPCPSLRIQTQDCPMPISSGRSVPWSASTNGQNSLPQVDDQAQVSYYHAYPSDLLRLLTLLYDRLMAQLFAE